MKRSNGFTLIELLVVIFIIAIVAVILLQSIFFYNRKKVVESDGKATKSEVKVEKKFSRFVVTIQELECGSLSGPYRLVYIQDTKTGQEWLAVRDHGLALIPSSATVQSLKCEADNK